MIISYSRKDNMTTINKNSVIKINNGTNNIIKSEETNNEEIVGKEDANSFPNIQIVSDIPKIIHANTHTNIHSNIGIDIDAVFLWVDMRDEAWLKKYRQYTGRNPETLRYKDYGELEFSVKLLLKHCKFIRNIYIVTDNQIPNWYSKEEYPTITIVDHSQILDDRCHRPTFKSDSIEAYIHRISGLSEYYLYLNDDTFIGNNCNEFSFIDRRTMLPIARFISAPLGDNIKMQAIMGRVYPRAASLTNAMNCVKRTYGGHHNKSPLHQCCILRKSMAELAWQLFPTELARSVKYPTRNPINDTISFTLLSMLLGITTNRMKAEVDRYSIRIYMNYSMAKGGAYSNFMKILQQRPQLFCINDLNDRDIQLFESFKKKYY